MGVSGWETSAGTSHPVLVPTEPWAVTIPLQNKLTPVQSTVRHRCPFVLTTFLLSYTGILFGIHLATLLSAATVKKCTRLKYKGFVPTKFGGLRDQIFTAQGPKINRVG